MGQLTDIAWPVVLQQVTTHRGSHWRRCTLFPVGGSVQKMGKQERNVLASLPQGRHQKFYDIQPIKKVFAKGAVPDGVLKVNL